MIRVKICGITNIKDAQIAVNCGADAVGFVFAPGSPRRISVNAARRISGKIAPFVAKVGVFVNAKKSEVLKTITKCRLNVVQFHGDETDNYCAFFRKRAMVIKAFRLKDKGDLKKVSAYQNADAFLFDAYHDRQYGGTGKSFDLKILKGVKFKKPVIIAGGLSFKNINTALKILTPYAVDVASGVEKNKRKKDAQLIFKFINRVKAI
ncbi:MAG: phosphoribosylanthranilate isomerase [Candidatus Omnitrophota bacterium]